MIKKLMKPFQITSIPLLMFGSALVLDALAFPAVQLMLSYAQKYLVNAVEYQNTGLMRYVYILAVVIIFFVVVVNPLAEYFKDKAVHQYHANLQSEVSRRLLSFEHSFFETTHSGEILTKLNSDIDQVIGLYRWSLHRFLLAIFYGIGSILMMFFLNWQMAIIVIAFAIFETWLITKLSARIQELSKYIQEKISITNEILLDIIKMMKFIRIFSVNKLIQKKYSEATTDVVNESVKRNNHILIIEGVSELLNAVNVVGILSIGIWMYFMQVIDLGSVMAFLVLQDGITYMFQNLGGVIPDVQQRVASIERLLDLLDYPMEKDVENINQRTRNNEVTISGKNLSFQYKDENGKILDKAAFTVSPYSVTAITGKSGSGKSTFVKLLMGFYEPDFGNIMVNGTPYSQMQLQDIRNLYAYVGQNVYLFYDTIEENIRCGNQDATFEQVVAAAKLAQAHDFIEEKENGYATLIREHGANFSGGQKQRIAIARAILRNTPVIIWDEATSAIDGKTEELIHKYLSEQKRKGKTVIVVAHKDSILSISDYELRLVDGRFIDVGSK